MKHAVFLTLCLALLVDVCAKGGRGGGGRSSSGSKGSSTSWFSSSSKKTSSTTSSKGKTGSNSKSTKSTSPVKVLKPVKDVSGRGWGQEYPTQSMNTNSKLYPNWNPKNRIMSPRYSGNFAHGAYGPSYGQGGSPFAYSVQSMGMYPSRRSMGYGKQAVVAAGTGAVAGAAVGYGLGRFPRPHYQFHDSDQEFSYNHYMYQHYGSPETRKTNTHTYTHHHHHSSSGTGGKQGIDDSSSAGDRPLFLLESPPTSFDNYMSSCMKRKDLLQSERTGEQTQSQNMTKAGAPSTTAMSKDAAKPSQEVKKGAGQENEIDEKRDEKKEEHDEVVNIVEIGYPALIEQLKNRKCVELYAVYTQKVAKQQQDAYNHGSKPAEVHFISTSLLCLIGSLILY